MTFKLTFNPYEETIEVQEGENLLLAASEAGIHINASCGGEGVCGTRQRGEAEGPGEDPGGGAGVELHDWFLSMVACLI